MDAEARWVECHACGQAWLIRGWYVRCFECGHVYPTRWHLLLEYRWERLRYWRTFRQDYSLARIVFGPIWRPSKIVYCQCCLHDF